MSIIIQGLGRCQMKHLVQKEPYTVIDVKSLPEKWPDENNDELFRMLYENFHYEATDYIKSNANYTDEAIQAINELSSIHMQCNFMCSLLPFSIEDKIKMLKEENLSERIMIAIRSLNKVRHLLRIQTEIENKTHYDLDEQQKEYFLKQQIKNIREELGEGNASPEKKEILEKAKKKNWSEEKLAAAAQVARAKGAVAEVNSYVHEMVQVATHDGEVGEIYPEVGELVGTGSPIMTISVLKKKEIVAKDNVSMGDWDFDALANA